MGTGSYGLVLQAVGMSRLEATRPSKELHTSYTVSHPFPHSSPWMIHSVFPSHLCSEIPYPTQSACLPPYRVRNALGVGNPRCILIIPGPNHIPGCQPALGRRNPPSFLKSWAAQAPNFRANLLFSAHLQRHLTWPKSGSLKELKVPDRSQSQISSSCENKNKA